MANLVTGPKRSLVNMARTWWHQFSVTALQLLSANRSVSGYHLGYLQDELELVSGVVTRLLALYNQGRIKPHVDSVWPFEKVSVMTLQGGPGQNPERLRCRGEDSWGEESLLLQADSVEAAPLLPFQVVDAMKQMQDRKNVGKIVLVPGPEKEN